jgi:hypothetical protein
MILMVKGESPCVEGTVVLKVHHSKLGEYGCTPLVSVFKLVAAITPRIAGASDVRGLKLMKARRLVVRGLSSV